MSSTLSTTQRQALELLAERGDRGCGISTTNWRPARPEADALVATSAARALARKGLAAEPVTERMSVRVRITPAGLSLLAALEELDKMPAGSVVEWDER